MNTYIFFSSFRVKGQKHMDIILKSPKYLGRKIKGL